MEIVQYFREIQISILEQSLESPPSEKGQRPEKDCINGSIDVAFLSVLSRRDEWPSLKKINNLTWICTQVQQWQPFKLSLGSSSPFDPAGSWQTAVCPWCWQQPCWRCNTGDPREKRKSRWTSPSGIYTMVQHQHVLRSFRENHQRDGEATIPVLVCPAEYPSWIFSFIDSCGAFGHNGQPAVHCQCLSSRQVE